MQVCEMRPYIIAVGFLFGLRNISPSFMMWLMPAEARVSRGLRKLTPATEISESAGIGYMCV